ncbi:Ku protein [Phenylobacterium sp.]|uniref:non-homologous end joining protein Ku n=1 Tax=Phenylobacterium sp. TaxID=1871053 RepID=UPI0027241716|nr:Ku protein [Phenylobacterium sp.]MDO8801229.1 Ku protein [Phenylobacterium sp.]
MAARPTWQGHLRLSLVSCPVALYTATSRTGDVSFNMLHKTTHNRIRMIPTDPETGPVDRADIVKGYEIEKDHYVVVTPEEIDSVRLESTRTIDIDKFVDAAEIDRLYWNDPYFLVPDGKVAVEAFTVIREAMEKAGKIALGRLVMHQRERMLAMEPRGKGLVAYTLRTFDEVKTPESFFDDIPEVKADKNMIEIAAKIIEQQEGDFDPSEFKDHYEEALRALIQEKGAGRKVTVEEPKGAEVIDLMEALRRSLAGDKKAPAKAVKPPAKKAAAKHSPAKKRA